MLPTKDKTIMRSMTPIIREIVKETKQQRLHNINQRRYKWYCELLVEEYQDDVKKKMSNLKIEKDKYRNWK